MPERLSLRRALHPLEAFFDRLPYDMFERALENFVEGIGHNPERTT
ncbi:hypothetical protein [Jannaschia sp. LMIT008]|nr:hypothetical protein [Jannaschia sp. LMIT008]